MRFKNGQIEYLWEVSDQLVQVTETAKSEDVFDHELESKMKPLIIWYRKVWVEVAEVHLAIKKLKKLQRSLMNCRRLNLSRIIRVVEDKIERAAE